MGRSIVVLGGLVLGGLSFAACGGSSVHDVPGAGAGNAGLGGGIEATSGAGGADAGAAGREATGGDTCAATHARFGTLLGAQTVGVTAESYDGPALVERSTPQELFLYFELPEDEDPAGAPSVLEGVHVQIQRRDSLPILPVGAELWLRKTPAANQLVRFGAPLPPWAFSVYDEKDGALLLGAAARDQTLAGSPFPIGKLASVCVGPETTCERGQVTYQSVEVLGDEPVLIADSDTGTVRQHGRDYDVRVTARAQTDTADCPQDYVIGDDSGVTLEAQVQTKDAKPLIDALPFGSVPSCGEGNAPRTDVFLSLYNTVFDTTYDGPVFYAGKDPNSRQLLFNVPGLPAQAGMPAQLGVDLSPGIFAEPKPGDEYRVITSGYQMASLRDPGQGGLRLFGTTSLSAPFATDIANNLKYAFSGVTVGAQRRCDYAPAQPAAANDPGGPEQPAIALWDVVFGTTPPTIAKSGELTPITLDGKPYHVWIWGEGTVQIALYLDP